MLLLIISSERRCSEFLLTRQRLLILLKKRAFLESILKRLTLPRCKWLVSLLWRCCVKNKISLSWSAHFTVALTLTKQWNGFPRKRIAACVFDLSNKRKVCSLHYTQIIACFLVKLRNNITCVYRGFRNRNFWGPMRWTILMLNKMFSILFYFFYFHFRCKYNINTTLSIFPR